MTIDIIQCPVSDKNFTPARHGESISILVIHTEQGSDDGTAAWFDNPHAHASAHYSISFEGRIRRFVQDADMAWHSGNLHINKCSIGIELEGFLERGRFPDLMMSALAELCEQLITQYHIPRDRQHIIGHNEVPDPLHAGQFGGANHHQDPGPQFPWNVLMAALGTAAVASVAPPPPAAPDPVPTMPDEVADPMVCSSCHLNQAVIDMPGLAEALHLCGSCAAAQGLYEA